MAAAGRGRILYVLGAFPKVSETFVSGEVLELSRQGQAVDVVSLRRPRVPAVWPADPRVDTTYLPQGVRGAARLAAATAAALSRRPRRAVPALASSLAWAWAARDAGELARFSQAAFVSRHVVKPETIHLHAHFASGPASVAVLVSALTDLPCSFTGHARDIFERTSDRVLAEKVRRSRLVIAVSEHGRARIADVVGRDDLPKLSLVRNGIDLSAFRASRAQRCTSEPPLVLAVSRLRDKKGLDTLIEAVALLRDQGLDCRLEILGHGPAQPALEDLVRRRRLEGRVALRGAQGPEAVREALGRASVFALPCRVDRAGDQDGLPVSLTEAMAAGVPVVTTAISGIPELVTDGISGLLVPPDQPTSLAPALRRVLTDEELAHRLAAGGARAVQAYDRQSTVRQLRSLLTAVGDG